MGSIFNAVFYQPIFNILITFYKLLGDNLGLAIIAIAVFARLLMVPLTLKQIQMAEKNKEFSEKVKEVKKKFKNNKEKQNKELMKLQSEFLPSQLGGCLPLIFQLVLFVELYRVIQNIINQGISAYRDVAYSFAPHFAADYHIDLSFFHIVDLGKSASSIGLHSTSVIPYIILIVLVGLSQYYSTKILSAMNNKKEKKVEKDQKKDKNKPDDFGDIMQASTKQAMLLMPALIMFISFGLPSGVSIYWITQSGFVILQQFILEKFKNKKDKDLNKKL